MFVEKDVYLKDYTHDDCMQLNFNALIIMHFCYSEDVILDADGKSYPFFLNVYSKKLNYFLALVLILKNNSLLILFFNRKIIFLLWCSLKFFPHFDINFKKLLFSHFDINKKKFSL